MENQNLLHVPENERMQDSVSLLGTQEVDLELNGAHTAEEIALWQKF